MYFHLSGQINGGSGFQTLLVEIGQVIDAPDLDVRVCQPVVVASNVQVRLGGIPAGLGGLPLAEEQKVVHISGGLVGGHGDDSVLLQCLYLLLYIFKVHCILWSNGLFTR